MKSGPERDLGNHLEADQQRHNGGLPRFATRKTRSRRRRRRHGEEIAAKNLARGHQRVADPIVIFATEGRDVATGDGMTNAGTCPNFTNTYQAMIKDTREDAKKAPACTIA